MLKLHGTSTRFSLFFDIFDGFRDISVKRIAKIDPLLILGGNIGTIVLTREGSRFEANCNVDYTKIFI